MSVTEGKRWLNAQEAADYLRFKSPETVKVLARNGQVRASQIGSRWVFDPADLDAYVEAQMNRPKRPNKR